MSKSIAVFGVGPGLGQAVARRYAKEGHAVAEMEKGRAAGDPVWEMPAVDPDHLVGLLWTMHGTKGQREAVYP